MKTLYHIAKEKIYLNRWNCLWWSIVLLLIMCAALRPTGIDRDSSGYVDIIRQCVSTNFEDMDFAQFEPSFYIVIFVSKWLFHDTIRGVFIVYALLGVFLKAIAIRKILGNSFFALFTYVCLFYILHELTQMRAGVAIGFFLLSINDLASRKPLPYFIKTAFAIFFHYSALIMIPLYFVNKRSYFFYLLPLLGIILSIFLPSAHGVQSLFAIINYLPDMLSTKLNYYLFHSNFDKSPIWKLLVKSKVYIFYLFFFYFLILIEKKNIIKAFSSVETVITNIFSSGLFIYFMFIRYRALALRFSEFLIAVTILMIPLIASKFIDYRYRVTFIITISFIFLVILIGDQIIVKKLLHIEYLINNFVYMQ